ncbi:MAG: galactokinase [Thermoleophilaceae bacterium]
MASRVVAFGPGRANLIGEHTDYNDGLSLPFAIAQGVRVTAERSEGDEAVVRALDYGEHERFPLATGGRGDGVPRGGWRDFAAGALAELTAAGVPLPPATLTIEGDVPPGAGLASSAALEVALCLALLALAGDEHALAPLDLARLCSRIENDWVGARSGLLDQLAALLGRDGSALRIDFRTLATEPVPLDLNGWRLVAVDSGEQRALAGSGYNERRAECERARELLGLESLRDARHSELDALPEPLGRRVAHVIDENARVEAADEALRHGEVDTVGRLLDSSHVSLRDLYDASTPAVERTVDGLKRAGAAGARMMGGGFGGAVLALFPPAVPPPPRAIELAPAAGARLLERS